MQGQSNANQYIRDYLTKKDGDIEQFIPQAYNISQDQKQRQNFQFQQFAEYEMANAGKCIEPCFTNMKSPVVSQLESDCMTNCQAKGLEVLAMFRYK